jgi:hypothetical protein
MLLATGVWARRVPEWERTVLLAIFGGFLLLGLLLCRRQLLQFRLRRTWALARGEFRRAVRHQLWWLVPAWFVMLLGLGAYLRAPSPVDRLPQAIEQTLVSQTLLPLLGLLVWTAASFPNEARSGVLAVQLTKPATALELIAGRALGVSLFAAALVACFYVLSLGYLWVQGNVMLAEARETLAKQEAAYAASPTVANFPNPNLRRVVQEGALVSLRSTIAAEGMKVGAVPAGQDGKHWLRGGTRERASFLFPEICFAPGAPRMPSLRIRITAIRWVEPSEDLPRLVPASERPVSLEGFPMEVELRPEHGKGLQRQKITLDASGQAVVPIDPGRGILSTWERPRGGGDPRIAHRGKVTVNLICDSKDAVAVGVDARSVMVQHASVPVIGRLEYMSIDMRPLPDPPSPRLWLRDVEGSMWIRGDGREDEAGRFLPSGELAWFDFDAIDPQRVGDRKTVPLRITCRAMRRKTVRDPVTGEMLPTRARVRVQQREGRRRPFVKGFIASQVGDRWIDVPRELVTEGPVRVYLQCMTQGHAVGFKDDGVQFVLDREPFAANLLRAELVVLIHLASAVVLASVWASLLNRPLAICGALLWYLFGSLGFLTHTIFFDPFLGETGRTAYSIALQMFPQYWRLAAADMIRDSRAIEWAMVSGHLVGVGGYALCHVLFAAAVLNSREVHG